MTTLEPFELLVARHGAAVFRVCRALLGPHEAEDAWSETFLAALKAYPDLDPGANVQAWLVTIAKRKAIDQHRAAGRRPTPSPALPDRPSTLGIPGDGDEGLWTALAALTQLQREAIAYHYLGGLPYAEVAVCLGNSEAAARRAATDGMKKLRANYLKALRANPPKALRADHPKALRADHPKALRADHPKALRADYPKAPPP